LLSIEISKRSINAINELAKNHGKYGEVGVLQWPQNSRASVEIVDPTSDSQSHIPRVDGSSPVSASMIWLFAQNYHADRQDREENHRQLGAFIQTP
jgi:hypothetical protein